MGATNGKLGPPIGNLTLDETMHLRTTFVTMSGFDGTEKPTEKHNVCSYKNFQKHCETHLDDWLAKKITDRLAVKGKGTELVVNLSDFQEFASAIFKSSAEDKFETIWSLLVEGKPNETDDDNEKQFQADEIYKYNRSIIESYAKISQQSPKIVTWRHVILPISADSVSDLAHCLLQDLFFSGVNEKELISKNVQDPKAMKAADGSTKKFSLEAVVKALSQNLLFLKIHSTVFSECFGFQKALYSSMDILPICLYVANSPGPTGFSVLDLPKLMFLNAHLTPEYRTSWKHLYSSNFHGESFSKLLSSIQNKGPTVLIIKDNTGRIFGAFASESWNMNPKFYGNEKSFLFHLSPRFVIYSQTGYNKNFQYFNTNQKTLPNGLGMGGTLEYFGLWIDSEFGKGKCSPSCTTFNCPQLSTNQEFTIDHLEVWGVGDEPKKEEGVRDSILDKDPEAKALLEMMGKHTLSEGQREEPKEK